MEQALKTNNVFVVATVQEGAGTVVDGDQVIYASVKLLNGVWVLGELRLSARAAPRLALKTLYTIANPLVHSAVEAILCE